jgi:adenylate cyclase class 2
MIEIEVKVRAGHRQVKDALAQMGARFIGVEKQSDTYYNAPHRDFAKTDEALRIRCVNGASVLTYKGRKLDTISKTREEFETIVEDDASRSILLSLGFTQSGHVRKSREIFRYKDFIICLDKVDGLGEFVEIELMADADPDLDIGLHRGRIFGLLEKMGIHESESIRTSYLEMILEK